MPYNQHIRIHELQLRAVSEDAADVSHAVSGASAAQALGFRFRSLRVSLALGLQSQLPAACRCVMVKPYSAGPWGQDIGQFVV